MLNLRISAFLLFISTIVYSQSIDYNWDQVPIGGGGYIIGMKIHPSDGTIRYFRTDIGGAYRWDEQQQRLVQLIFFGSENSHYYGVAGIALDPNNIDRVIMAVGRYCDPNNTAILVSNDRGETWTKEIVPGPAHNIYFASNGARSCTNGGNDKDRQGSPIILNPNNSDELFIGSRGTGLWKLTISTEDFSQISNGVIPTNVHPNSIRTLAFHPTQSQMIFVAYAGQGIYRGNINDNNSFVLLDNTTDIKDVNDLSISKDGDYMLLACKHSGIFKAVNILDPIVDFNKVLTYTGVNRPDDEAFLTVTCSPFQNNIAITVNGDWEALNTVRVSTDSGNLNSWDPPKGGDTYDNIYPWHTSGDGSHISQFAFDPDNPNGVYFTSWFTTFYTADFTANTIQWTNKYSLGHEEAVITDISAFPINSKGNFLAATGGDQTGFLFSSIVKDVFPNNEVSDFFDNDVNQIKGNSFDYSFGNSEHLVISTSRYWDDIYKWENGVKILDKENTGQVLYSTNGGMDFISSSNYDVTLGKSIVAMSSGDPNKVVIATHNGIMYSDDHGATFSPSNLTDTLINTSVFSTVRPLAADKVLSNVFYFYDWRDGKFYKSTNFGQTFNLVYTGLPAFGTNKWKHKTRINPIQGKAGHIWINFQNDLYWSDTQGSSWTRIGNVQKAELIAVGKQMGIASYPTIFLFGKANNDSTYGYYRSIDKGLSWSLINDTNEKEIWGGAKVLGGDMNVEGRIYMSAGGLGLFYGDDASIVDNCDPSNMFSNHSFENGYSDWQTRQANGGIASFNTVNTTASEGSFSAEISVQTAGQNYWDIQVKRNNIAVDLNQEYVLRFDAKTAVGSLNLKYGSNAIVGNAYVMDGTANLNTNWQSFEKTFTSNTSADIYLAFNYGLNLGTFYLDNVTLQAICPDCPDADNDTVCDVIDACPGFDDMMDDDGDGIPNGCDQLQDCELVENGDMMPNLDPWVLKNFSTASGAISLNPNGFMKVDVQSTGTSNWHLGARQGGILLENGHTYEVSYMAYADSNRDIDIIITNPTGGQFSYHSNAITTAATEYVYQFTMNSPTFSNALINLNVGANIADVYFDKVSIQDIACDGCGDYLELMDQDIYPGEYRVQDFITTNGTIDNTVGVTFNANNIILESGFNVTNGSTFSAYIAPCP